MEKPIEVLTLIFQGALVHGTLYLLLVFCGGVIEQNPLAWKLAIVAAGLSYLSYAGQASPFDAGRFFVFLSIVVGAAAGIALIL